MRFARRLLPGFVILAGCATNGLRYESARLEADKPLDELGFEVAEALPEHWKPDRSDRAPFEGEAELNLGMIHEEVRRRNPKLVAKQQAWRAAVARYPQVTSFDDPMISAGVAPGTLLFPEVEGSDMPMTLDPAIKADASQRIPWPGKLTARGEIALEQAASIRHALDVTRLDLEQSASLAYFEYWFSVRAWEVNERHRLLLNQFKSVAERKYSIGQVSKQDALQAEVELDHLTHQDVILNRRRKVAQARLNTLMNRPPDEELPPPGEANELPPISGESAALRERAINGRPELRATAARLRAEVARLELARKEFFPDVTVMGTYNMLWEIEQLRTMIGAGVNLPIQRKKRHATVDESLSRIEGLRAELADDVARVAEEVQVAYERLLESRHVISLYRDHLMPIAHESLNAARSGYESGELDFLRLLSAQRELLKLETGLYQARLDHEQRIVDLDRALGFPVISMKATPRGVEARSTE